MSLLINDIVCKFYMYGSSLHRNIYFGIIDIFPTNCILDPISVSYVVVLGNYLHIYQHPVLLILSYMCGQHVNYNKIILNISK